MSIKVKNIFITGGNRGIGLAFVKHMLIQYKPDHLFATYRNAESSKELLDLGSKNEALHPIHLDISNYGRMEEIVKEVDQVTNGTGINLLINNSGLFLRECKGIMDVTRHDILTHMETNTIAPIMIIQAFLPLLKKGAELNSNEPEGIQRAAVVNVSTLLASISDNSSGGSFSYRVSKTALNMATKCISLDLKDSGISTILIHPGWVKTNMGTDRAPLEVDDSVKGMMNTFNNITLKDNGKFLNYNGTELPW